MIPIVYEPAQRISVRACQTQKLKVGMISLSAVLPIDRETSYLTSLLLSVLHRGTEKYPTIAAINRRLDYLYGTELSVRNYYRGDLHVIGTSADLLGEEYLPAESGKTLMEDVLDVMSQILFHPLTDENGILTSHYVESEKALQCDAIRALKNSPRAYAIEHCSATLYENEPCGAPVYGTEELVSAVTPEMLTEHWKKLCRHMKLHCFYVGPESPETVRERVTRALLPQMQFEGEPISIRLPEPVRAAGTIRNREESLPVSQGQLVIGLRTATTVRDDDYVACTVLNEMLGVSPVSKLFVNVREKEGLCYHCSSYYNMYKGVILISCGLRPDHRERAEREILNQLEALRSGDFDENELYAAKKSLQNAYRQIQDNPAAMEGFYLGRSLYGVDYSLDATEEKILSVGREDILRVAARLTVDTVYFLNGTATSERGEWEDEQD